MPVAAPADKRFRRSHVRPGKKRRWIPSWRALAIGLVVSVIVIYAVSRAAGLALSASALTVSKITLTGTQRMATGEALALLDGLRGSSIVTADLEPWRVKLLGAPWVADAAMRKIFPGTVSVVITEREPLGIGRIRNSLYLIDREGSIIDEFGPKYADFDLPIIDGLSAGPGDADDSADLARAALAGRVLEDFQRRPELARLVSQVDVSNVRDAVVILKDDTALIHTGDDHFVDRLQLYLDLAPRLREDVPRIDSVDLRYGERVFVKPQGTTAVASVASAFRRKK
jgi:cell division septal protein FtsQ